MENDASGYRRFLAGDDRGMAEIVETYKDGLILFLNQFVHDIYTAEELAEETFFRLMIKKPAYSGRSSFKTWLYAIGRNAAIDHLRRRKRQAPAETPEAYADAEADLERAYIREEEKRALRGALWNLPSAYRQILWLIYFEELSHDEAATVMKKSPRQIRNLLYRAKQSLRQELEKGGFVYEEHR